MRIVFDSIGLRVVLLLLVSLSLFHICSLYIYQAGFRSAAVSARDEQLAERLVSIKKAIISRPKSEREVAAHSLSTAALDIHWSERSLVNDVVLHDPELITFRDKILSALPGEMSATEVRLGYADEGTATPQGGTKPHLMLVSFTLPDNSWINFTIMVMPYTGAHDHGAYSSLTIMALGIIAVSFLIARIFTASLRDFTEAAEQLGNNINSPPLPVGGPSEVRKGIMALNIMQKKIQEMVDGRAKMLAAISHDLRTPLTRLRLRNEFLPEGEAKDKNENDILEMQELIDAALDYLRGETEPNKQQDIDLAVLVSEAAAAFSGPKDRIRVDVEGDGIFEYRGDALGLRRAVYNLLDNAIRYGTAATISLTRTHTSYIIAVADRGPGIPDNELPNVIKPFYRLSEARNTGIKGSGLGLSIVDAVVTRSGGHLSLANRQEGGLIVQITLPLSA